MARNEIYGMLSTTRTELPAKDEEQRQRFDQLNQELKGMARAARLVTDWGYQSYDETMTAQKENEPWTEPAFREPVKFESGDLVKIFKTVTDGAVTWQGTVKLDASQNRFGTPVDVISGNMRTMFADGLPAKLEKNGQMIYGALDIHFETGMEGVLFCVRDYSKTGYQALIALEDGDELTVYSEVYDGAVEWEGKVDFTPDNPHKVTWIEVMREPNHMDTLDWMEMSFGNRPVVVTPKPEW